MSSIINNDPNVLMIRCDCYGHVLEVASDVLGVEDGIIPDFYFSVWNQTPTPFNFWDRLKLIWWLICGKNLEGGDVIISLSDAIEISKFLAEKVEESRIRLEQQKNKKEKNAKENNEKG
jgi:hypothetical protein